MSNITDLLPKRVRPYAKAVVVFVGGGLVVAYTALADGAINPQEWVGIALGTLGLSGVAYGTRNDPTRQT